jgi:TrmH family RNA methyltransferase
VRRLHQPGRRRAEAVTLIEGPAQIADAAGAGASLLEVFTVDPADVPAGVTAPVTVVSPAVLGRMAGTAHPRGPLAVAAVPPFAALRTGDTVVLWDVTDPGNAGAIVRSAAGFGFAVAVTRQATDVWSPKAVRAAAATQFRTTLTELGADPLGEVMAAGLAPLAMVVEGGEDVDRSKVSGPVALLIGSEAHGLPEPVVAAAMPVTLRLDNDVESLNAAVAAGVMMHHIRSVRRGGP